MSDKGSRRSSQNSEAGDRVSADKVGQQEPEQGRAAADGSTADSSRRGSFSSVKSSTSSQRGRDSAGVAAIIDGGEAESETKSQEVDEGATRDESDGKDASEAHRTSVTANDAAVETRSTRSEPASTISDSGEPSNANDGAACPTNGQENSAAQLATAKSESPSQPESSPAEGFAETGAIDGRRTSLPAPETPTATSTVLSSTDRDSGPANQSVGDAEWRESTLDSVALSESTPLSPSSDTGSIVNRFQSVSFTEPEAGPSTPSTSHRFSTASNGNYDSRRLSSRSDKAGSGHNYDLIAQHAQSLQAELQDNPKRKRRSEMGSADLRASFAKLRDEAEQAASSEEMSKRASASTETDEAGQPINWDLWGEIMSDYEGMAKERRESPMPTCRSLDLTSVKYLTTFVQPKSFQKPYKTEYLQLYVG